ncbi:MAG: glucodextranase DOMON-like domain-containing protein [Thermosphaera sp.]
MKKLILVLIVSLLFVSLAPLTSIAIVKPGQTVTVGVDLAHGESNKYLDYIMGNITFVNWKIINTSFTTEILADVDILLIGQPTASLSPEELDALLAWLEKGDKVLYVAGDSDYGGGINSISAVNGLLEYIGAKLRLEEGAVYSTTPCRNYTYKGVDSPVCCGAYYRMNAFVEPDDVPELFTSILDEGIQYPILMHGPNAVIWMDELGNYRDPINETFPGLIRIAWYRLSYIGDNQPPSPRVYDPLIYGTGDWSFVAYAAEYHREKNNLIVVAGESLYGDYEPAWASLYYGVQLDGPKFVTNLIRWFIKILETYDPLMETIAVFSDPVGDDKGAGTLLYPTNPIFVQGIYDLVKFGVHADSNYLYFRATVKNLGGNPWSGPNGFSLQNLQIYIKTTSSDLPTSNASIGLNVNIWHGWHYAVVAIPGWGSTPYPDGEVSALFDGNMQRVADEYNNPDLFDVYVSDYEPNTIEVKIAKSVFPDPERVREWVVFVALASYDGYGEGKVRGVQAGDPAEWVLGGGDPLAILAGVQPKVIDVLAPTPEAQYSMLGSYDTGARTLAKVSGFKIIGLLEPTMTGVETVTETVTNVQTETVTITTTTTQTQEVVTTRTETSVITESVVDYTLTGIVAGVLVIIIVLMGFMMLRKK